MPLPTTNLTLHLDASDTDKLFTTWVNDGPHTGTPADGNAVQAWMRETDGSVTPATAAYNGGAAPAYRSGTPLMLLPCLDFDGTDDAMAICSDATVASYIGPSSFFSTTARTILVSFYGESITASNAGAAGGYSNHGIIAADDKWYLNCFNDGGQRKVQAGAHDGSWKMVAVNISEATNHVALVRHDGTNLYLSVDGGSESSVAVGTISGDATQIYVGRSGDAVRFNGRIGEVAFYSSNLTGTDKTNAITYFTDKWVTGGTPDGEEALAGSAATPGHGTATPGISISI
jgi:hypothetical protein